jgi:sugar phosphate isomerase/epimerase
VQITRESGVHLTYCTNIHPADGWASVYANLQRYPPALKDRLSPSDRFGIGLRLSARDARELRGGGNLEDFRSFLDGAGLYVALINGFPHGSFHGTPVKAGVYAPDWREDERLRYTVDLVEILRALLPHSMDGGISTLPLSYKTWMAGAPRSVWERITQNIVRATEALVRVRESDGKLIHLDIEPEPDCLLENTAETVAFFHERLLPEGGELLARSLGVSQREAQQHLLEHVRVCFDCCHFAVEYEDPSTALERLIAAGIRIGRVQLSSALRAVLAADPAQSAAVTERLRRFAEPIYLHQVVERQGSRFRQYFDLDEALASAQYTEPSEWRVHFHVPLFTDHYDGLQSTQEFVRTVVALALEKRFTTHLEIETYTWDVLPAGLKMDLLESITREYQWVLGRLRA